MDFIRYMLRTQPVVFAICVLAIIGALFFGGRLISEALYFNDPDHKNQPLEPWMTPRYVGMSYGLPRHVIMEIMDLDDDREGRTPHMRVIAARLGMTLPELEAKVRETAKAYRENPDAFRRERDNDDD